MNDPQLFCFTYAGGSASFFDIIEKELPNIQTVKFEYAGHGMRHSERCYQSFNELADDIYGQLKKQFLGGPYHLFGYSMGTITLVEVLKRILADQNMQTPDSVFLAAHEPITKKELIGFSDAECVERVKQRTIQFGAVPEKLIHNESFWRMYLPLYRADYSIIGKYRFEELDLRTEIPATVFYSETDTPRREMELWRRYFIGKCDYYQFPGNHFFIREHHQEIAAIIKQRMGA